MEVKLTENRYKLLVKMGMVGAAALVVAPIIFTVVKGIIGLAIAAALGGLMICAAPAVSTWLTAMKFKALKSVISANPIETLQGQRMERVKQLERFREALNEQTVELERFRSEVHKMQKNYPDEAARFEKQLVDFERLLAFRVDQFKAAKKALVKFEESIKKAEAIYRMSMASQKAGKALNANEDFMSKFKEEVAFDAIEEENIRAIAALQRAMDDDAFVLKEIEAKSITTHAVSYDDAGHVVLGNILQPQTVKVRQ